MKDNSDNPSIYRHGKATCQQKGCYKRANRIIKTSVRTSIVLCKQHYEIISPCKHYDREEIDQSKFLKRIICKDCKKRKCLVCDNFFDDKSIPEVNLYENFCSNKCLFESLRKTEEEALANR